MSWSSPRVLYVQYTNPAGYPPLEHSSRILADAGWNVLLLGTGAFGANDLRLGPHPRVDARYMPFCPPGPRQKLHYLRYVAWACGQALRWQPDWIYASDPLACPVAMALGRLCGARVLYHEHDSPDDAAATSRMLRLVMAARRRLGRRAALAVLPNADRATRFVDDTRATCPVVTVWNCPGRDEVGPERSADVDEQLNVIYHGSIVPQRFPESIVYALAQLPATVRVRVVGYETTGHAGYIRQLMRLSERLGVGGRLEFIGAVPSRSELLAWNRRSDVGLALLPKRSSDANERQMVGASNKPFDYLASGLAVLVSDSVQWRTTYAEPRYGLVCEPDDPASIAAALRWFLDHPDDRRAMGERGRRRILTDWNYEQQFQPVLERLIAPQARAS